MRMQWVARVLLPLMAVVVTVLVVEGIMRLAGAYVPVMYYLPEPGDLRDAQSDYDVTYHVDAHGLRKMPAPPALPANVTPVRIALVGDSFTFGQGVEAEDAMPVQLERRLRAAGLPAEVVSVSSIGAGAPEYRALFRYDALPLRPSLVVVNVFGNDASAEQGPSRIALFLREASHRSHLVTLLRAGNRTRVLRENVRLSHEPQAFWAALTAACCAYATAETCSARVSGFRAAAGNATNNLAAACLRDPQDVRRWVETDTAGGGWAEFVDVLRDIHRRCAAAGIPMILGVVPDAVQVDPSHLALVRSLGVDYRENPLQGPGTFQGLMEGLGREMGVPVYSPLPAFRAAGPGTYLPHDLHWSAAGHRLYTQGLAEAVQALRTRP